MSKKISILLFTALTACCIACSSREEPTDNCELYRLQYLTDIRYQNGQAFTNQYAFRYENDGRLMKRYTIYNGDTTASDYVKVNLDGFPIESGNLTAPLSPELRYDYSYQSNRLSQVKYWSSVSPGAPIQLAQTSVFTYVNGPLTKIENFAPGQPQPSSRINAYFENGGRTHTYVSIGLPALDTLNFNRVHYSNWRNPLAELDTRFGWPENHFLADTVYFKQPNGTIAPGSYWQYELDGNRVLRSKEYQVGNPPVLTRDITYEYECL